MRVGLSGVLVDEHGHPLRLDTVVLYYTFRGISSWVPIISDSTDGSGNYSVTWTPQATGDYVLKAEWAGNATHGPANTTVGLSSTSYNSQYVFSVESNSSISLLSYNGTARSLSFQVTGQAGTRGYARITVAKSLIDNASRVGV